LGVSENQIRALLRIRNLLVPSNGKEQKEEFSEGEKETSSVLEREGLGDDAVKADDDRVQKNVESASISSGSAGECYNNLSARVSWESAPVPSTFRDEELAESMNNVSQSFHGLRSNEQFRRKDGKESKAEREFKNQFHTQKEFTESIDNTNASESIQRQSEAEEVEELYQARDEDVDLIIQDSNISIERSESERICMENQILCDALYELVQNNGKVPVASMKFTAQHVSNKSPEKQESIPSLSMSEVPNSKVESDSSSSMNRVAIGSTESVNSAPSDEFVERVRGSNADRGVKNKNINVKEQKRPEVKVDVTRERARAVKFPSTDPSQNLLSGDRTRDMYSARRSVEIVRPHDHRSGSSPTSGARPSGELTRNSNGSNLNSNKASVTSVPMVRDFVDIIKRRRKALGEQYTQFESSISAEQMVSIIGRILVEIGALVFVKRDTRRKIKATVKRRTDTGAPLNPPMSVALEITDVIEGVVNVSFKRTRGHHGKADFEAFVGFFHFVRDRFAQEYSKLVTTNSTVQRHATR